MFFLTPPFLFENDHVIMDAYVMSDVHAMRCLLLRFLWFAWPPQRADPTNPKGSPCCWGSHHIGVAIGFVTSSVSGTCRKVWSGGLSEVEGKTSKKSLGNAISCNESVGGYANLFLQTPGCTLWVFPRNKHQKSVVHEYQREFSLACAWRVSMLMKCWGSASTRLDG